MYMLVLRRNALLVVSEELYPGYHCQEVQAECPVDISIFPPTISPNSHLGTIYIYIYTVLIETL